MNREAHNKAMHKYYRKRILTARGKAQQTKRHMQANSKKRGHEWSDDWWTLDMIEDIITNGKCAVTGLSFSVGGLTGTGNRNPFNASPDRIDNTKGYEPANVQWVVFIYNLMKSNFKDEDVVLFIKKLQQTSI